MISLFSSNKNIKDAHATIAKLQGDNEALKQQIEDLKKASADAPGQVEALKKEHATAIETLTNEHNLKVQALEQQNESTKQSVMKEVSQKITAIGIPEDAVKVSSENKGAASKYVITQTR